MDYALSDIIYEYNKAIKKHPPFHSAHEGYAVILEELDELFEEVKKLKNFKDKNKQLRIEASQLGAMALRFIIDCCSSLEAEQK